jgi:ankyrin repeat protein
VSDALPLPPRPNLESYKKLAKDLQHACQQDNPTAVRDWAVGWTETLARLRGLAVTPEVQTQLDRDVRQLEQGWQRLRKTRPDTARCTLADAQLFIARGHGFANWPRFARHLAALARDGSPVSTFEAAVDAVVGGDLPALEKLLNQNQGLVRARSTREHRATLLHYVSANGVEDYRQKTPPNIVEITRLLLKAGADVNAEADAYGGGWTTLGLTATSCHPENAGVQLPLLELLLDHGAALDGRDGTSIVNSCLANGRGQAAAFCAARGARLDLEGAAGVGRLDVVQGLVNADGSPKPPATPQQLTDGFAWACEFGRTEVVEFLLQRGVQPNALAWRGGQTALHWAAYGGHVDIVKLLLGHGAAVGVSDQCFNTTPLEWALHGWGETAHGEARRERYYEAVALLVQAGATLDAGWFDGGKSGWSEAVKLRADPRMRAAVGASQV